MRLGWVAFVLAAMWVLPTATVAAQSDNELNAARRLYREGVRHAQAGRWREAREAFEQSLSIAERPATLLNLAGALAETGEMVAGAETYRRYLRAATDDRYREQAQNQLDDLEARMPKVTLEVTGLDDADRLELDGEPLGAGVVGLPVPVDPGAHEVAVIRDGETVAATEFEVEEREAREVALHAPPAPPRVDLSTTVDDETALADEDGGGGVFTSPAFWIITAVLVVGAGVAVGVVLATGESGPGAYTGNVGMGRIEI